MIRICCKCNEKIGEKKPLQDPSITHGVCDKCMFIELKKMKIDEEEIKKIIIELNKENTQEKT